MFNPEVGGELSPDDQMVFEQDARELKEAGDRLGVHALESRVKFGLDPAAMMVNRDSAPLAGSIARVFGTSVEDVWPLIKDLHKRGPWAAADRLSSGTDNAAKTYLVLAAACHEAGREGYAPAQYMEDRQRVMAELGAFGMERFDACKENLRGRVKNLELVSCAVSGIKTTVPVAEGDVALPLAMDGYHGCVSKAGDSYFAQTAEILDGLLEAQGLTRGFAETFNPATGTFERVDAATPGARVVWVDSGEAGKPLADMRPAVKRIASGYVLTYGNKELAVELIARILASYRVGSVETMGTPESAVEARQARVERLRSMVSELFPGEESIGLRENIERSFSVPQVGDYHNEGAFMDSHLDMIVQNVESVGRGEFPENVPAPTREALTRAVRRNLDSVKKYVFLHDIAKADCLTIKFADEDRVVSWDEWRGMLAASAHGQKAASGDEEALRAFCAESGITGVSYYQISGEGKRQHGKVGADELRASGAADDEAMLAAIETHEVAYLFEKINAVTYEKYFGEMSDDVRDFALLASYADTMSSIRPDGKPDLSNFLALAASREKYESLAALFARLEGGKSLDKAKFDRAWANLRKSSDPLSEGVVVEAEAKIRAECRVVGYDMEKLRVATDSLVEAGTLTVDERDRLLALAAADPQGIGRVFGQKMKQIKTALDASRT